jgi:predicted small lipoprotein YifL
LIQIIHSSRLAAVAAVVVALAASSGLSACGRKSGLDLPPAAAVPAQEPVPGQAASGTLPAPTGPAVTGLGQQAPAPTAGGGNSGAAVAPPPSGRGGPFILDWLLN